MKKFLTVLILSSTFLSCFSQTEMGNYLITAGTNLSALFGNDKLEFNGTRVKSSQSTHVSFNPGIATFLLENLAVGIQIPITYSNTVSSDDEQTTSTMNISPFAQYFIGKDNFKPYLKFSGGYNYMVLKASNITSGIEEHYSGISFEGGVGASYFITNSIAWNIEFAYESGSFSYSTNSNYLYKFSSFKILSGFSFILEH
jgi:hypothetical protein